MGPVFYVMAILGCGEADAACQQIDVARVQYASMADCNASTAAQIEQRLDSPFPVVVAQCQRADSKLSLQLKPADVALPEPDAVSQPRAVEQPGRVVLARRN